MTMLDHTHDAALRSWVASANAESSDFPVQNLPFGAFRRKGSGDKLRIGVAIGDQVLDLKLAREQCPWGPGIDELLVPLAAGDLKPLMSAGTAVRRKLRSALSLALAEGSDQAPFLELCLVPQAQVQMQLPCAIGDYTDFFTGIHHATAVGKLFRPDNPLLANYKWVPIAYHGRASSIGVSPQSFVRPLGQSLPLGAETPRFGPSQRLDYELELGVFVGAGNAQGQPLDMAQAEDDWFGIVLLNDWSARDIQAWEYQPLGPFLAKNFATTISPWIVTREALEPFRAPFTRPAGDPQPLAYLDSAANRERGQIDIALQVLLQTEAMRKQGLRPAELSRSNFRDCLLERGADAGAPQQRRLQPADRRSFGHRYAVRAAAGAGRVAAGAVGRRQAAAGAAWWRNPQLPAGRRHGDPARPLRTSRRPAHRLRGVRGYGVAGASLTVDLQSARMPPGVGA